MTSMKSSVVDHMDDFVDRLYGAGPRPSTYLCGALRKPEMKIVMRLYLESRPSRSLEWGLGSGISAAAFGEARRLLGLEGMHVYLILSNKKSVEVGASDAWRNRMMDSVAFSPMTSEQYLTDARKCGTKFDFMFIDGDDVRRRR